MKYYRMLLALCQDLGVNPLEKDILIIPGREKERIVKGSKVNIKDVVFGEDASEIEKISEIVNNLYLRVENHTGGSASASGFLQNQEIAMIRKIAETYEDVVIFLVNRNIFPEAGLVVDKGVFYKTIDQDELDQRLKEANHKIRNLQKSYLEAYERYLEQN